MVWLVLLGCPYQAVGDTHLGQNLWWIKANSDIRVFDIVRYAVANH